MSELETAGKVIDKAWEAFDKIEDSEKKEWFLILLDQANENSAIKWCKEQWNQLSEDQKMKLYDRWAISLWNTIKNQPIVKIQRLYYDWIRNTVKHWAKNAARFKLLEEIPVRFFVECWIFDKPEWLTDEQLYKDVKSDAWNLVTYLNICKYTAMAASVAYPEVKPIVPVIEWAKKFGTWYKEQGADVVIASLNNRRAEEIKEGTSKELAWIIWWWEKKQAA